MKSNILKISEIDLNNKMYPRILINQGAVNSYARAMKDGDEFPHPIVAYYKGKYILVDGRHRIEAMMKNGEKYIKCDIMENILSDEQLYLSVVRSNLKHGVRYTMNDKLHIAVGMKKYGIADDDINKILHLPLRLESKVQGRLSMEELKSNGVTKIVERKPKKEEIKVVSEDYDDIDLANKFYNFLIEFRPDKISDELSHLLNRIHTILAVFKEQKLIKSKSLSYS